MWKRSVLYTVRLLANSQVRSPCGTQSTHLTKLSTTVFISHNDNAWMRGVPFCHASSSHHLPGHHIHQWCLEPCQSESNLISFYYAQHLRTISNSTSAIKVKHLTEQSSRCSSTDSKKASDEDSKRLAKDASSETASTSKSSDVDDKADSRVDEASLSIFQRFKQAYKEHGKVLIGVHLATSSIWFGAFYYAASKGIDVVPLLEQMGLSDTVISPLKNSSLGDIAMAYLMYKVATPARYAVTLAGTNLAIKYFRRTGRMQPLSEGARLREFYQDGKGQFKEKKDRLKEVQIEKFQQKVTKKRQL